jgi:hypothetical protein
VSSRLVRTNPRVEANAGGESFGRNDETATQLGFFGALGGELFVGPGAALLELQLGHAGVDGFVLRDTNTSTFNAALGYRLFL